MRKRGEKYALKKEKNVKEKKTKNYLNKNRKNA